MMFIPWFEVTTVGGDTAYFAALAVQIVNYDPNSGHTEIVAAGKTVKTKLSPDDVFQRMGEAIEGARDAEMELLAKVEAPTLPARYTPDPDAIDRGTIEPLPGWAESWLPSGKQPTNPVGRDGTDDQGNPLSTGGV